MVQAKAPRDAKKKSRSGTTQTSEARLQKLAPAEIVPETVPLPHRYLGNNYVQAMTATDTSCELRALSAPLPPSPSGILQRKCACGNPATGGRCSECSKKQRSGLQTKLEINEPGDIYEQEADRIADQVMATPPDHEISGAPPRIQRFSGQSNAQLDEAPASVDQALASSGRPLEPALREEMEQRFRYDFSTVRVHTDARAVESAQAVSARAYTVGRDIIFAEGQYAPDSKQGRMLLAHELTHTIQQSATSLHHPITSEPARVNCEPNAEASAARLTTNSKASAQPPRLALQRAPAPPGGTEKPAKYDFALDKRKRTWRRYARSEGQKDADRIRKSGKLSAEDREEVNAKLGFFEGKAKEIYIREIRPTLLRVVPRPDIEMPEMYVGKLSVKERRKLEHRRYVTTTYFSRKQEYEYQLKEAYIHGLQLLLEGNDSLDFETMEQIVQERFPNAPWHKEARREFLAKRQAQEQEQEAKRQAQERALERQSLLPQLPAYWQNQMGALSEQIEKWPQEAQSLARDLLWKWYELRKRAYPSDPALAIPGIEGSIEATIRKDLVSQFEQVLRAAEQRIQEECRMKPPGTLMKVYGDPCKPWFETPGGRGPHALHNFEALLKIYRDEDGVPYRTIFFWVEKYLKQPVPVSMAGRHLELLEAWALVGQGLQLAAIWSATFKPTPLVTAARPPTARPVAGTKPIPANVRAATPPPVAPPVPVEPAGTLTGSRIPPFPRRDLIRGQFPASPAAPAAPARPVTPPIATGRIVEPPVSVKPTPPAPPARPPTVPPARAVVAPAPVKPTPPAAPVQSVRPKGLRGWLFGTKLKLAIEGVEVSGAAPGIGAGGATASTRPTPAVVVKSTPQPAAPTSAPLATAPTPPRAVSPAKTATPSAPSRPITGGEAIGTSVPAPTPAGTTLQPPGGTAGGIASIRVAGGATSQSTIVPGVATTTATAGSVAQGTGFTHDQVLDLFVRYFKRPGPPQGTIILHPTQASYEAAEQAAGYQPGETLGFFDTGRELVHLPPTVSDLTAMHEALHMIGRQSGVEGVLGRYVEEGLTEWLARSLGPVAERRAYDGNVAFVRLLANIVGEDILRDAYLHRLWAPLRSALRARLGSEAAVQHLYHQLKQVGPQGENGRVLQGVFDMLWPGSSTAEPLTTTAPAPAGTTGGAVSASVPATQRPGGPGGGGRQRAVPRDVTFDEAVDLGRALVDGSVWLQEIRRISGLEQTRRAGELRDFIEVYSRHSGTAIKMISGDEARSYGIGPSNWGTYLADQNRIVMHVDIFTATGVNPVREIGHEVGAAELRRVYGISKDNIPTVDVGPDVRSRMGGDSLTHVIDTLIKVPD